MKQGLTLPELAARVAREQEQKHDYVADTQRMQFNSNGTTALVLDGNGDGVKEFSVSEHAHGQIAARLGVPKRYYDRLREEAPTLLDSNVNHWFTQKPEKRMIRTLDAADPRDRGTVRGFLSDRYKRLDYDALLAHVIPILGETGVGNDSIVSCNISETKLYLKVLFPGITGEVKLNDVVQAGVVISNSEVGAGALKIEPLVYRLVCLNGMVVADATLKRYHVGRRIEDSEDALAVFSDETLALDDAALFAKVGDVVRAASNQAQFDLIVAGLQDLAGQRVTVNPIDQVQELAKRASLTEDESKSVLLHLIEGADLSAWGYLNAVTRASQEVEDYERATELERLGGQILANPALVLA